MFKFFESNFSSNCTQDQIIYIYCTQDLTSGSLILLLVEVLLCTFGGREKGEKRPRSLQKERGGGEKIVACCQIFARSEVVAPYDHLQSAGSPRPTRCF